MQIVGATWIGLMLDNAKISSQRTRGLVSVAAVAIVVIPSWIGLTVWLYKNPMDLLNPPLFDWTDGPFGGFFFLNLLFGMDMVIVSVLHRTVATEPQLTVFRSTKSRFSGSSPPSPMTLSSWLASPGWSKASWREELPPHLARKPQVWHN